ncbi:hypothetical protein LguiA_033126 [Lonicera macranthoides]
MVKDLANEFFTDEYICDVLIKGWCVDGKLEEALILGVWLVRVHLVHPIIIPLIGLDRLYHSKKCSKKRLSRIHRSKKRPSQAHRSKFLNVACFLQRVPEYKFLETLMSFLFEARARVDNPIGGYTTLIVSLQQKVEDLQSQVTALEARLEGEYYSANFFKKCRRQNLNTLAPSRSHESVKVEKMMNNE